MDEDRARRRKGILRSRDIVRGRGRAEVRGRRERERGRGESRRERRLPVYASLLHDGDGGAKEVDTDDRDGGEISSTEVLPVAIHEDRRLLDISELYLSSSLCFLPSPPLSCPALPFSFLLKLVIPIHQRII